MIGGLKTIFVKAEHEREFESLFNELRNILREQEPDCLLYSLLKSRASSQSYIVQEQYRDQAAFDRHQASPHGKTYSPKMRALIDITVEYFDVIVA
ncbi:MAG: putative quinol monooxygenase [Candidatus Acidiferrum sp.]|jgi:quinol monooxygenase YgiN